jgi:NTP pyrophosphatase (non-canonical NTP hydrolase)
MDFEELIGFIENEDKRLKERYGNLKDDTRTLARTVKLSEEFGELCNDVLAHYAYQRTSKLENHDREKIREEFADIIFTTFLIAKSMGIDIVKGIESKMEKIKKREY